MKIPKINLYSSKLISVFYPKPATLFASKLFMSSKKHKISKKKIKNGRQKHSKSNRKKNEKETRNSCLDTGVKKYKFSKLQMNCMEIKHQTQETH